MIDVRCKTCKSLLARVDHGQLEVKCKGCKTVNHINVVSQKSLTLGKP